MSARVWESEGFEDSGFFILGRVLGDDAEPIVQADISTIELTVTDLLDDSVVTSGSLTVSDVVFDTLQTDARWTADETGYNFRYNAPASAVPNGGRRYRFEFKFTPNSGEVFHISHERVTGDLKRS